MRLMVIPAHDSHPIGHPRAIGLLRGRVGVVHAGARLLVQWPDGIGNERNPSRHVFDIGTVHEQQVVTPRSLSLSQSRAGHPEQ
ncbi:MAG: hypothetical protein NTW03_18410, partial [Verrucomicrobia bacterium]|nr:hypothetical protein [Verrucomicrobiota bacterium]